MRGVDWIIITATAALPLSTLEGSARRTSAPVPATSPGTWVSAEDYPVGALRSELQGTTEFKVNVGAGGRVKACRIVASSGSSELDEATCRLVTRRAKFIAATNSRGATIAGTYSNRVRWALPAGDPGTLGAIELLPRVRIMAFSVSADGTLSDCREEIDGKAVPIDNSKNPCTAEAKLKPYRDAQGHALPKRVVLYSSITVSDLPK